MRKLAIAAVLAAAAVAAAPVAVASADEPLLCKVANSVGEKYLGGDVMYCIDDPNPGPLGGDPW